MGLWSIFKYWMVFEGFKWEDLPVLDLKCLVPRPHVSILLDLTAIIKEMHPSHCGTEHSYTCKGPAAGQMAFLLTGFGLLVVGAGGIRPCNLAFGADQCNLKTESGKKGINIFFNWYYFTFTFANIVSSTLIVYVQSNISWSLGSSIPPILMFISIVLFLMGSKMYVKVKASGSPLGFY